MVLTALKALGDFLKCSKPAWEGQELQSCRRGELACCREIKSCCHVGSSALPDSLSAVKTLLRHCPKEQADHKAREAWKPQCSSPRYDCLVGIPNFLSILSASKDVCTARQGEQHGDCKCSPVLDGWLRCPYTLKHISLLNSLRYINFYWLLMAAWLSLRQLVQLLLISRLEEQ